MRCTHCGAHPADGSWFCPACFRNLPGGGRRRRRRGVLRPVGAMLCVTVALGLGAAVNGFLASPGSGVTRAAAVGGLEAPRLRPAASMPVVPGPGYLQDRAGEPDPVAPILRHGGDYSAP